ncbi:MAG: NAD(P)/FAD-dependent oxidoreductase [Hyphomicrobiales bacterium]|nr:NAD(P)/FAD-dependent oxidoreductase [Alphaproteobacteria bacterium]
MTTQQPILIAGGGPVGVIAALALARQGLPVRVFEADDKVNEMPRAATTHAATLEMLAKLGMVDEIIKRGYVEPLFRIWDNLTKQMIAEFDFRLLKDETPYPFAVQCEQHKLAGMAIERLKAYPHAKVEFSARVGSIQQSADGVEVEVEAGGETRKVSGSYLIGSDGGRSTVRKALGIEFAGYTHPERFMILTTPEDIGLRYPGCTRNYVSDPDAWFSVFKVSGDASGPLWRVLSSTRAEQTDEELMNPVATEHRLQRFLPKQGAYDVVHRNLYNVHQRVAASFRKGRVFLAGDAAHVNNPLGGLGLNFGIHDVVELSELLGRVIRREAPETILDEYDLHRRPLNIEFVQQQTVANKKRMEEKDPAARTKDFEQLQRTMNDPAAHKAHVRKASLIESVKKRAAVPA